MVVWHGKHFYCLSGSVSKLAWNATTFHYKDLQINCLRIFLLWFSQSWSNVIKVFYTFCCFPCHFDQCGDACGNIWELASCCDSSHFFPGAFWHNLCSFSKGVACLNEYVIQDRFASFRFKLSNLFVFFFFSWDHWVLGWNGRQYNGTWQRFNIIRWWFFWNLNYMAMYWYDMVLYHVLICHPWLTMTSDLSSTYLTQSKF